MMQLLYFPIGALLLLLCAPFPAKAAAYAAEENRALEKLSAERLIFHTNLGDIAVAFYPNAAPKHVAQILRLAKVGAFDGIKIFRVEPGFVAQIQSHTSRRPELNAEQLKAVKTIPSEFSSIKHRRGHLSMARFDDPNSADTSFSFMLGNAEHLDGRYSIFGTVVAGMDVLTAMEDIPADRDAIPEMDIVIQKTTLVPNGNLALVPLAKAVPLATPDAPYQAFFKVFAALAFFFTVLLPVVKTAYADLSAKRAV